MLFGKHRHTECIKITINDIEIEHVFVAKFLGVLIEEKLSWIEHINKVKSRLSKCVSNIYKARDLVNKERIKRIVQFVIFNLA